MMCLTPENRALVADGIAHMRATARPGYIALAAVTRTDLSTITADALSFSLIPRLNAAGRMADPTLALDLLLARDAVEAGAIAKAITTACKGSIKVYSKKNEYTEFTVKIPAAK